LGHVSVGRQSPHPGIWARDRLAVDDASLRADVEKIYALDAAHNLNVMSAALGTLIPSDMSKIVPILGLFYSDSEDDNLSMPLLPVPPCINAPI
jgi:hypothetical protein